MKYESYCTNDTTVVVPAGPRIDARTALDFKECLRPFLEGATEAVTVDLRNIAFIDSSGLGAIVALDKLAGGKTHLTFANPQEDVVKVFNLTQMHRVLHITQTAGQ